jgi:hypothetical protein
MGILAVYDTVGIQNYIFASNKLAENVGGSKLVADIFAKWLPSVISEVTGEEVADWRKGGALKPELKAEIIYQGGGNAYVAFADEETLQAVTKNFLTRVSAGSPGVGIAVAAIETALVGNTYKTDFERLNKRLSVVKGGFNNPPFAGNQPITKQSGRTGLPVSEYRDGEYLSASQVKKRDRYTLFKAENKSKIEDFSDLAFEKGSDSLIAIIHADGNNMGSRIKTFMEQFNTYAEAVPAIRALSDKIDKCYKAALDKTIKAFNDEYADYLLRRKEQGLPTPKKKNKNDIIEDFDEPPLLKLISDGDDITLVIGGRFALDCAALLLREIEKTDVNERPFADVVPTACAGVVLFHDHYPFSEAYKLAEELCASAKKPSREKDGSYIDFHLHQSGSVASLHHLRERQFVVDGKSLIARPWRILTTETPQTPKFSWFEKNIRIFKDDNKIPRNKTKALRNAIAAGETQADIAISQMRGNELPELPKIENPSNKSKYAAYFDLLELYDAYENLLNKEGLGDVE